MNLFRRRLRRTAVQRFSQRAIRVLAVVSVLAAAFCTTTATAHADSEGFYYTYNRPSTIEAGGATWMAWADTTANGSVHVVDFGQPVPSNNTSSSLPTWTDSKSTTYYGTGPTVEASNGTFVVAYTDLANHELWLAEPASGGGLNCYAAFYASAVTPYLVSEGKDGSGALYVVTTDDDNTMEIAKVTVPSSSQCAVGESIGVSIVKHVSNETSWGGPALAISGYGTSNERYWLMWSGTDAQHHINVAEYDTNWNMIGSVNTEQGQWTNADIGGAYSESSNTVWLSYCGTNGVPYYQTFSAAGFTESQHYASGTCSVTTYSARGITFYSGGVGISYDYTDNKMILSWADNKNVTWDQL